MTIQTAPFSRRMYQNLPSLRRRCTGGSSRHLRRLALSLAVSGTMATATWFGPMTTRIAADDLPTPAVSGGISILIHQYDPEADLGEALEGETAAASTGLGTHDSCPLAPPRVALVETADSETGDSAPEALTATLPSTRSLRATSPRFNRMLALAVTASARRAGVAIEPLLEPFAMVGPTRQLIPAVQPSAPPISPLSWPRVTAVAEPTAPQSNAAPDETGHAGDQSALLAEAAPDEASPATTLADIDWQAIRQKLQRWSKRGVQQLGEIRQQWLASAERVDVSAEQAMASDATPAYDQAVAEAIETLAQEEPLDIETIGPIDVQEEAATHEGTAVNPPLLADATPSAESSPAERIAESEMPAGSAPMVVTIEEAYLPYDLAARDLKWLSTPVTSLRPIAGRDYYLLRPEVPTDGIDTEPSGLAATASEAEPAVAEDGLALSEDAMALPEDTLALPEDTVAEPLAAATADSEAIELEPTAIEDGQAASADLSELAEVQASPECLIDEAVWQAGRWLDRYGVDQWSARLAGYQMAQWTGRSHQLQLRLADRVAQAIPRRAVPVPVPDPIPNTAPEKLEAALEAIAKSGVEVKEEKNDEDVGRDDHNGRLAGELNLHGPEQAAGAEVVEATAMPTEDETLRSWQELAEIVVQVQEFVAEQVAATENLVQTDEPAVPAASIATQPDGESTRR